MDISDLIEITRLEIPKNTLKFTQKTTLWCTLPYPNHPNGCPNYNKNPLCPPNVPSLEDKIKTYSYFYLILCRFNLMKYKTNMLDNHPNWSERQATCLLYWQGSVKKHIKLYLNTIYNQNPQEDLYLLSCGSGFKSMDIPQAFIYSMEAVGIDVLNILQKNNINYEIKPKNYVVLVNLLCTMKKLNR